MAVLPVLVFLPLFLAARHVNPSFDRRSLWFPAILAPAIIYGRKIPEFGFALAVISPALRLDTLSTMVMTILAPFIVGFIFSKAAPE
jgi:hypothetical protein